MIFQALEGYDLLACASVHPTLPGKEFESLADRWFTHVWASVACVLRKDEEDYEEVPLLK